MLKKLLITFFCFSMFVVFNSFSVFAGDDITYLDENGNPQRANAEDSTYHFNLPLRDGYYYIGSNATSFNANITVAGTVYLIIKDNCTFTVNNGSFVVNEGSKLVIYTQSIGNEMGTFNIFSRTTSGNAGIGGEEGKKNGEIIINGGIITSYGSDVGGAGIGSGANADQGGKIVINNGIVKAYGRANAPGIGGTESGGDIFINGGDIKAYGENNGPGIGAMNDGGNVYINGGSVLAEGYGSSPGIGGQASGGIVEIKGASTDVSCTGMGDGYDIGSGVNGEPGTLLVTDGANLSINMNGTNSETTYIDCTILGVGAGETAGNYCLYSLKGPDGNVMEDNDIYYFQGELEGYTASELLKQFSIEVTGYTKLKNAKVQSKYPPYRFYLQGSDVSGVLDLGDVEKDTPKTFSLAPINGLPEGNFYMDTITISDDYGFNKEIRVCFYIMEPAPTGINIDYINEKLVGFEEGEVYKVVDENGELLTNFMADGSEGAVTLVSFIGKTVKISKYIYGEAGVKGYSNKELVYTVPSRSAAPTTPLGVNVSVDGGNDGRILGVSSEMEYNTQGEYYPFTPITSYSLENLSEGVYFIRYKATDSKFASEVKNIFILSPGEFPTYILSAPSVAFDKAYTGYGEVSKKPLEIYNSGNSTALISSVIVPEDSVFEISGSGSSVLSGETISTWLVSPKTGLSKGTYEDVVTVIFNAGSLDINVSFEVQKKSDSDDSSSSGGGSSSYEKFKITTEKEKIGDETVVFSTISTEPKKDNEKYSVNFTEETVEKAVEKALAKADDEEDISVRLSVDMPKKGEALSLEIARGAFESLIDSSARSFEIDLGYTSVSFDLKAINEMLLKSKGDITIKIAPAENLSEKAKELIGSRPAYSFKVSYGNDKSVDDFGKGNIIISIEYFPKDEDTQGLFGVYADDNGNAERISNSWSENNDIIIETNHFSVYGVGYEQEEEASEKPTEETQTNAFADIKNHWAEDSINFVVSKGLFFGVSETEFAPNNTVSRGMLLTILGRLSNESMDEYKKSSFNDVENDKYYMPYIEWAYKNGIVAGVNTGEFAPEKAVSREQSALIFERFAKYSSKELSEALEETVFSDSEKIDESYKEAVKLLQKSGIMIGDFENKFNPKAGITRAELSSILKRFIEETE